MPGPAHLDVHPFERRHEYRRPRTRRLGITKVERGGNTPGNEGIVVESASLGEGTVIVLGPLLVLASRIIANFDRTPSLLIAVGLGALHTIRTRGGCGVALAELLVFGDQNPFTAAEYHVVRGVAASDTGKLDLSLESSHIPGLHEVDG